MAPVPRFLPSACCGVMLLCAAPLVCGQSNEAGAVLTEPHRPEWVHIPAGESNLDFYLDRASAMISNGDIEFWDVVVFQVPTQRDPTSERWIKEKRTLRRVRCALGEQALLRGSSFDEAGHLIEAVSRALATVEFTQVHPGTVAASELMRVCKDAGLDTPELLRTQGNPVPLLLGPAAPKEQPIAPGVRLPSSVQPRP